jgi:hypothetical protein
VGLITSQSSGSRLCWKRWSARYDHKNYFKLRAENFP